MSKPIVNPRKAAVVGCGFVGSATAFALMQSHLFSELVLVDVNFDKADGEAKDIAHGIPFAGAMKIYAGTYDDIADAAIIIVTAGANQKPEETRLDLVHKNVAIFKSIIRSGEAYFLTVMVDVPLVLLICTEKTFHHRRLAGSILPHKTHDSSAPHIKIDVVQNSVSAKGLAHTAY